jgi:hypothetical protein
MGNIVPFLRDHAFGPSEIQAMSLALDEVCTSLGVADGDNEGRRIVAERIVALAQLGEYNAARLRDRVIHEASSKVA